MDETPQDTQLNSSYSEISELQRVKMEIVDLLHLNMPLSLINWANIQSAAPNRVRNPAKYLDQALRELVQDGVIAHRPHDYSLSSYFLPPKEPEQDSARRYSMAIPEAEKKGVKGVNPKDMIGATKIPLGLVPPIAIAHEAMTFQEGAAKYGPFNWRRTAAPVQMMTYLEAALGHILSLIDGQDIDPSSGSHHAAHARACLAIILDATACGNMIDNRPSTWPNRAKGVFSRDPASLLGDQEKVKALLSRKWYTYPDEGEPE
jgi:Domain of unknown function (DUF5664)